MPHLVSALPVLLLVAACRATPTSDPLALDDATVASADGVPVHYRHGGTGDTALVFVHGWLGDASVWEPVLQRFAPRYRVAALDLAGHGRSGDARSDWTVDAFAADVASVVRALDAERAVLIGHSMSGAITVEAARRLGPEVVLLVPVDTLGDLEWDLPPEVWDQFFGGLRADFPNAVDSFFRGMLFAPTSPPEVVERVVSAARAAEPERSVRMLEGSKAYDVRAAIRTLAIPIHAIQSDRNPTKLDVNRRYAPRFEAEVLPEIGHWPMLEDPQRFGDALERVLARHLPSSAR